MVYYYNIRHLRIFKSTVRRISHTLQAFTLIKIFQYHSYPTRTVRIYIYTPSKQFYDKKRREFCKWSTYTCIHRNIMDNVYRRYDNGIKGTSSAINIVNIVPENGSQKH